MKFLFQNNRIRINITRFTVMFQIFLYHLISYVSCTPNTVTDCPKVPAPISFRKFRIFFLQPTRSPSLQPFNNIADGKRWPIFDMNMNMVFTDNSFKYLYIFSITNLLYKITAASLNIAFQNLIPIFCHPNYMGRKPGHCVATYSNFFTHIVKLEIWVATGSLALKAHSFY